MKKILLFKMLRIRLFTALRPLQFFTESPYANLPASLPLASWR